MERQDQMQELRGLFLRPAEFELEVVRCALGYGGVAEEDLPMTGDQLAASSKQNVGAWHCPLVLHWHRTGTACLLGENQRSFSSWK